MGHAQTSERGVNLVLFEPAEVERPLPRADRRAVHTLEVLRRRPGDELDVGLVEGPRGKATLVSVTEDTLVLRFHWGEPPPPLDPIRLLIGLPRPQTARKVLEEATALGVAAIDFVETERADPNYARSSLWRTDEWRRHLIAGAEQAFTTRLPAVRWSLTLAAGLTGLPETACRLALDNYEAPISLSVVPIVAPVVLAVGPERGWSTGDRSLLREHGFSFVHLGERVLRTETACVAAIALVRAGLGLV